MPGRQSDGWPLLVQRVSGNAPKKKAKARKNALDAFAIATKQIPESKKGARFRDLDPGPEQKRRRHDGGSDGDVENGGPHLGNNRVKRQKRDNGSDASEDEMGSDSEGNEWRIGVGEDDEDSEINSDEAFGESDEEKFEGFAFRGSSSKTEAARHGGPDDEDDDKSLGEDAVDLAQALDGFSEGEEGLDGDTESGSEEDELRSESSDTDGDEDDEDDLSKLDALRDIVSGFATEKGDKDADDSVSKPKAKIGLEDLGLFGVKDPLIKKSLKLMKKEEKATKPSSSKKLDVPLAKRQQDQLLRIVASEKANQTLDRWQDTVKHNRRAEHLMFPLPESLPNAGLDNSELLPLSHKTVGTELEQTIMSIMEESGLGPSSKPKPEQKAAHGDDQQTIPRSNPKELWNQRRRERELHSREAARAKRIKKIKSKAYRRVHRKEQARNELAMLEEEELEGGGLDSEEEREAQHRQRAMERMGARHRESKWAKMAKNTRRAAWDDDFRIGLTDMARRDEELRRRVEGRTGDGDDSETSSDSGEEDSAERLLQELEAAAASDEGQPESNLMKMAFMQRAETTKKKANDAMIADLTRRLASDKENGDGDDQEEADIGRRRFGMPDSRIKPAVGGADMTKKPQNPFALPKEQHGDEDSEQNSDVEGGSLTQPSVSQPNSMANPWSKPPSRKERRKAKRDSIATSTLLDPTKATDFANARRKPAAKVPQASARRNQAVETAAASDTSSDEDIPHHHHPFRIRDEAAAALAFGGDDAEADFTRKKAQVEEKNDEKAVKTLPGWSSWVGEGVGKRSVNKDQKHFQTTMNRAKKDNR